MDAETAKHLTDEERAEYQAAAGHSCAERFSAAHSPSQVFGTICRLYREIAALRARLETK